MILEEPKTRSIRKEDPGSIMAKEIIIAFLTEKTTRDLITATGNHPVITEPTIMGMRETVPITMIARTINRIITGLIITTVPVTTVKTTTAPIVRQIVRHTGTIPITGTGLIITVTTAHTIITETVTDHIITTDRNVETTILNNANGSSMKK